MDLKIIERAKKKTGAIIPQSFLECITGL